MCKMGAVHISTIIIILIMIIIIIIIGGGGGKEMDEDAASGLAKIQHIFSGFELKTFSCSKGSSVRDCSKSFRRLSSRAHKPTEHRLTDRRWWVHRMET